MIQKLGRIFSIGTVYGFLHKYNLDLSKLWSFATDGVPSITGVNNGFINYQIHCIIHQEVLGSKVIKLVSVVKEVFINQRQFSFVFTWFRKWVKKRCYRVHGSQSVLETQRRNTLFYGSERTRRQLIIRCTFFTRSFIYGRYHKPLVGLKCVMARTSSSYNRYAWSCENFQV